MFVKEIEKGVMQSYSTYWKIFKTKNVSFHRQKKGQCSLYMTYYKKIKETKIKLKERVKTRDEEKN